MSIRLNKLLATRGIGARRKCDEMIAEGRVRVNGQVVREPGTTVEEQGVRIEVDGRPLPREQQLVYYALNKPVGVITTLVDPQGRRTVAELLPPGARLFPVGRLDADTSGLLLLTNDGELAHHLMHPRYGVEKVYRVRFDREPGRSQLERLARGVEFEPGVTSAPARVRRIDPGFDAIMIEIAVHEGRFRQVRRMCEAVGLRVTGLHRVAYGPVRMGPMARGMWRELSEQEVARLRSASARPRGRGERPAAPAAGGRPAAAAAVRPARVKPAPPPVTPDDAYDEEESEIEETWIPGGGFVPDPEPGDEFARDENDEALPKDAAPPTQWPVRAGGRRGDADFKPAAKERKSERKGAGPGTALPWHAPEFRRDARPAPVRTVGSGRSAESRDSAAARPPSADRSAKPGGGGRGERLAPAAAPRSERAGRPGTAARAGAPARGTGPRGGRSGSAQRPERAPEDRLRRPRFGDRPAPSRREAGAGARPERAAATRGKRESGAQRPARGASPRGRSDGFAARPKRGASPRGRSEGFAARPARGATTRAPAQRGTASGPVERRSGAKGRGPAGSGRREEPRGRATFTRADGFAGRGNSPASRGRGGNAAPSRLRSGSGPARGPRPQKASRGKPGGRSGR